MQSQPSQTLMINEAQATVQTIRQAVAGDAEALERLILRSYSEIRAHIAPRIPTRLKRNVSVEDLLQNTFVEAFRCIHRFRGNSVHSFIAWLKRIAERKLVDEIRRSRNAKPAAEIDGSYRELAEQIRDGITTPSRIVATQEATVAIQLAIAALPEHYRRAVQLHCIESKTLYEVAQIMQKTPGAVHGLICRAKDRLREIMGSASVYLSTK